MSRKRKNKPKKKQKHHEAPQDAPAATVSARSGSSEGPEPAVVEEERLSNRGLKVIGGGVALLLVGFYVLTLTDPMGRNWASTLSPLLILGAYAVIGFGIFLDDHKPAEGGEKTLKADAPSSEPVS